MSSRRSDDVSSTLNSPVTDFAPVASNGQTALEYCFVRKHPSIEVGRGFAHIRSTDTRGEEHCVFHHEAMIAIGKSFVCSSRPGRIIRIVNKYFTETGISQNAVPISWEATRL